jgi:hypothetical protein
VVADCDVHAAEVAPIATTTEAENRREELVTIADSVRPLASNRGEKDRADTNPTYKMIACACACAWAAVVARRLVERPAMNHLAIESGG